MARAKSRVLRGRQFWRETVRDLRSSGQTQREFAASRGLPPSSLARWARKMRDIDGTAPVPAVAPRFVEVATVSEADTRPRVRLLVGGAVAEFAELPPPEYLAAVGLYAGARPC